MPTPPTLARVADAIDTLSDRTGQAIAWLTLAMVLTTCLVVLLRYGFQIGSIVLQDTILYMHATVFMLGACYTLRRDAHVRVDLLYRRLSPHRQAWVNLLGTALLLMPMMLLLLWLGWDYVAAAWKVREGSRDTGGLPYVYLLKTLILLMPLLLLMQGCSIIARALLCLRTPDTDAGVLS